MRQLDPARNIRLKQSAVANEVKRTLRILVSASLWLKPRKGLEPIGSRPSFHGKVLQLAS